MPQSSTRQYAPKPKVAPEPVEHVHRHVYERSAPAKQKVRFKTAKVPSVSVGSDNAQGIIVTSALVTFALAFMNSYIVPRKTPRVRLYIGVAILYIALSVIAQFNAKIARAFAILVMVTALLSEGGGVLNWVLGRGSVDGAGTKSTGTPNIPPIRVPAFIPINQGGNPRIVNSLPALNVITPSK